MGAQAELIKINGKRLIQKLSGVVINDPSINPPYIRTPEYPSNPVVPTTLTTDSDIMSIKPGYETSELYLTAILAITSAVKVLGFKYDDVQITSLATLIVIAAPGVIAVIVYIKQRTTLKVETIRSNTAVRTARISGVYNLNRNKQE